MCHLELNSLELFKIFRPEFESMGTPQFEAEFVELVRRIPQEKLE